MEQTFCSSRPPLQILKLKLSIIDRRFLEDPSTPRRHGSLAVRQTGGKPPGDWFFGSRRYCII